MGFGAVIASGASHQLLAEELMGCITEIRVEQGLDNLTRFAIRFQEDLVDGELSQANAEQLQCDQLISIVVPAADDLTCLVSGPILDTKCHVTMGGPGSWFEIHGEDRRTELNRRRVRRSWSGRASAAAKKILDDTAFESDVCETPIVYGERGDGAETTTPTLNQRDTDYVFVRQIARQNNLHFWVEYESRLIGIDRLELSERINVKPSPDRASDTPGLPMAIDQLALVPNSPLNLRVHTDSELAKTQNVTAFEFSVNPNAPSAVPGSAINDREIRAHPLAATNRQPSIRSNGQRLEDCHTPDLTLRQRDTYLATGGDQQELQTRAESVLTEAGWFVHASASTTAHMLGGVLLPHQVIGVEGLGAMHSGPYQVSAVTHVINAAEHFMDVQLRRNAIGGG